MKILIISKEVWRNDQNGGNTLTGFFDGFPNDSEYAQIFCSEGTPFNAICSNYFKLTTKMVVRRFLRRTDDSNTGEIIVLQHPPLYNQDDEDSNNLIQNKKRKFFYRMLNSESLRSIVWRTGAFKSIRLKNYIEDFQPDIIFAPGYGVRYMNYLIQWITTFMSQPVISLVSDDYYSNRQMRISPFYWINHISFRKLYRNTVRKYDLIYTMSETQKLQLEKDFSKPVRIVLRGAEVVDEFEKKPVNKPIRLVYAGSLYYNRWKTLLSLAEIIKNLNDYEKDSFYFDIYSNSDVSNSIKTRLNVSGSSTLHDSVTPAELKKIYEKSDIAIHAESFDFINRSITMMSFSTKIVDCITSGCAVMCICDRNQGGSVYLSKHNAAICINSLKEIEPTLKRIMDDSDIISEYRKNAHILAYNNHRKEVVSSNIYNDFLRVIKQSV